MKDISPASICEISDIDREDNMFGPIKNENGLALIIALMLTIMLAIVGLGIIQSSNDEVAIAGNELNEVRTFYAAESGLDMVTAAIQTHYESTGIPPTSLPSDTFEINNIVCGFGTTPGTPVTKMLTKGSLAGLNAHVVPYEITSVAYDSSHNTAVTLTQTFDVALVPIFQFSVFYETDLEIAPGPSMFLLGRVHTNGDLYVQSNNTLNIDSYVTAHGDIHHGRKPGSGLGDANGDVLVKALDGTYQSMQDGSDWLDSDDAHWYDTAAVRWGGRVQDAAFGQDQLGLPLETPTDSAHKIIERAAGGNTDSYENKAQFKIIDGQAFAYIAGTWTNVTAPLVASGALVETSFHDAREGQDVTVVDLDMSIFKGSGYAPTNGIVYFSDQRAGLRGARIHDANDIGAPLTIASENPVYTLGDVNTTNKVPMAIIADALYMLSNNWNDDPAFAGSADKTKRKAQDTEINLCYITGNKETGIGGATYNGGLENLPRFLEDWGGQTLKYRGSIVNLWLSQMAAGDWSDSYYTPPSRNWAFDPDLNDPNNMPPGTPTVRAFIRWGWKQESVGYSVSEFGVEEGN
jgi:Tfp pilus assembly protein PilX